MTTPASFRLDPFFGASSFQEGVGLYHYIHEELFLAGDTGIKQRTINHWDSKGLLNYTRREGTGWRKFSFVEFCWIKLLEQIRQIGLPIETTLKLKNELFREISPRAYYEQAMKDKSILEGIPPEKVEEMVAAVNKLGLEKLGATRTNFLTVYLMKTIFERQRMYLLVFADGSWLPWCEALAIPYLPEESEQIAFEPHIRLSLPGLIRSFLDDDRFTHTLPKLNILQPGEVRLLELINSGEYEEISIHFKDKKMKSLELTKKQDTRRRIVDILQDNAYQEILIKTHQGLITTIINTIKIQL